jgi:hypothetical protein
METIVSSFQSLLYSFEDLFDILILSQVFSIAKLLITSQISCLSIESMALKAKPAPLSD